MDRQIDFKDFTRVRVEGALSINITRAETYSVKAFQDPSTNIKIEQSGDALRIYRKFDWWLLGLRPRPHLDITMPDLAELMITGASQGEVRGFNNSRDLTLKLTGASHLKVSAIITNILRLDASGASNITGDINSEAGIFFKISGASRVELTGKGYNASIELSGASQARLAGLTLDNVEASISGASSAYIKVNNKLDFNLNGASRLEYAGHPTIGKMRVSGASTLKQV